MTLEGRDRLCRLHVNVIWQSFPENGGCDRKERRPAVDSLLQCTYQAANYKENLADVFYLYYSRPTCDLPVCDGGCSGAVMFGLDPTVVGVRRSRLTYGVGVLHRFLPGKHPSTKKIHRDNSTWCKDVFDRFVVVDQEVTRSAVIIHAQFHCRVSFLADHTNGHAIGTVLRLSVCRLSVTLCIVAKRCVLEQKLLSRAYRKSYMRNR